MTDDAVKGRRAVIADDNLDLAENIAVLSVRGLYRDGIVEILRKHGFRRASGFASFPASRQPAAPCSTSRWLTFPMNERIRKIS